MENKILVGTSGWGYDEWIGPFYPKGIKSKDFLTFYSKIFYTNEINTTFYNTPTKWIVNSWVTRTPSNFYFTAKLPKSITHEHKLDLDKCFSNLNAYLDAMQPLITSKKLISFLIQLPPSFTKEDHFGNLREFIKNWPGDMKEDGYHLAVEFRHDSWMEDSIFNYLTKNSITYCAVIEPLLPPRMDITNPAFVYIRFHGYGKKPWFNYCFTEDEIHNWAVSIKQIINKADKIGIYFNNHFSGYAAKNSLMMMRELNLEPRINPKKVDLLQIKKESGTVAKNQTSLDKFIK
ncbi:MAG: DUF72 domain-containing protein [Promethearchaeota archaeon]